MPTYNKVICLLEKKLRVKAIRRTLGFQSDMTDTQWYRGLEYSDEFKEDVHAAQRRGVTFHIDPDLPVDLVMVAKKMEQEEERIGVPKKVNYYWVFWVALLDDPGLKKRLLFYQFYLSRVSESYRVKMIIVTDASVSTVLMSDLRKIAEENKFGLWTVDVNTNNNPIQIFKPKTFRDKMVEDFREPTEKEVKAKFPKKIRSKAKNLAMFFDTYVRDAVEAIVGITPEEAGKRYIDRNVLDLAFDLEKVSYQQKVRELVTDHLSKKTNDYEFVATAFDSLWNECKFKIPYTDFLKTFEPALHHLSAGGEKTYRDHYLHQFQVFLLGLHIIDKFYDKFKFNDVIEKQWVVASSFHDVAYPVQLYDTWSKKFFSEVFNIEDVGAADLKSQFIDQTLLSSMGYMIDSLCETHLDRPLTGNWLDDEKDLVKFFYKKITMVKHHCVLSAISLLKKASVSDSTLLKKVFVPAALAISLHHKEVWEGLKGLKKNNGHSPLVYINFDKDPIAFLLLFCDCIQEWGRPKEPNSDDKEEQKFLLGKIEKTESKYSLTIWTPFLESGKPLFRKKENEGKELEDILSGPHGVIFEVKLSDSSREVKKTCTIQSKL